MNITKIDDDFVKKFKGVPLNYPELSKWIHEDKNSKDFEELQKYYKEPQKNIKGFKIKDLQEKSNELYYTFQVFYCAFRANNVEIITLLKIYGVWRSIFSHFSDSKTPYDYNLEYILNDKHMSGLNTQFMKLVDSPRRKIEELPWQRRGRSDIELSTPGSEPRNSIFPTLNHEE